MEQKPTRTEVIEGYKKLLDEQNELIEILNKRIKILEQLAVISVETLIHTIHDN